MAKLIEPIDISGLDISTASRRAAAASREAALESSESAADLVAGKARRLVPRGPSGRARASLRAMGAEVSGGGSQARYFGWLDFGGRTGIKRSVERRYIRGGRYIWPMLGKQSKSITEMMEENLGRAVDNAGLEVT